MKLNCDITVIKQAELSVTDRWVLFSVSERPETFSFTEKKKKKSIVVLRLRY